MGVYRFLTQLGITDSINHEESRRTIIVNRIAIILALISSKYIIIFPFFHAPQLGLAAGVVVCSFCLVLFWNHCHFYIFSRVWVLLTVAFTVLFFSSTLGPDAGVQFVFHSLIILPFVLFSLKQRGYLVFGIILTLLTYGSLEVSHYSIFSRFLLSDFAILVVHFSAIGATLLISISSILFFYLETEKSKNIILEKNKSLEKTYNALKESRSEASELSRQLAIEELSRQSAYATLTRGIAHEIKNPLHMLAGRAELVLDDLDNKASVEKFAQVIIRNVKRLKKLIHAMLEYGASSGIDKETFSITTVIDDIAELSQHKGKEEGISISSEWTEDCSVFGNKIFIYQAILNLVVNAIQYTSRGGSITLSCVPREYEDKDGVKRNGVEVYVRDTGVGISKENLKNIFTPYYTSKARPENTGLGLSMAFKTVAENDGRLDVESEVGVGTTFLVCLPIHG